MDQHAVDVASALGVRRLGVDRRRPLVVPPEPGREATGQDWVVRHHAPLTLSAPDAAHQHPVATLKLLAEYLTEVPRGLQDVGVPVPRPLHHERLTPKVETARHDPPRSHRPLRILQAVHRAGRDLERMRSGLGLGGRRRHYQAYQSAREQRSEASSVMRHDKLLAGHEQWAAHGRDRREGVRRGAQHPLARPQCTHIG